MTAMSQALDQGQESGAYAPAPTSQLPQRRPATSGPRLGRAKAGMLGTPGVDAEMRTAVSPPRALLHPCDEAVDERGTPLTPSVLPRPHPRPGTASLESLPGLDDLGVEGFREYPGRGGEGELSVHFGMTDPASPLHSRPRLDGDSPHGVRRGSLSRPMSKGEESRAPRVDRPRARSN